MHDSLKKKNGCTYGKVEDTVVLKIQVSFNNGKQVAQSIRFKTKSVFKQPELGKSSKSGDEKIREQ